MSERSLTDTLQLGWGGNSTPPPTVATPAPVTPERAPAPTTPPPTVVAPAREVVPHTGMVDSASAELIAEVNAATRTVGYAWAGGVVLTDLDNPDVQTMIANNPDNGAYVPALNAWVSWCTPLGGLLLPDSIPIAPHHGVEPSQWSTMYAVCPPESKFMTVVLCDSDGTVVYVAAALRSKDHAPLLVLATLRTVEDTDVLPATVETLVRNPPDTWSQGWSLMKETITS